MTRCNAAGFVETLSRPGGNTTGFMVYEFTLAGKWLEFLRQVAPQVTRVAVLRDPANASNMASFSSVQASAQPLGVEVRLIDCANVELWITPDGTPDLRPHRPESHLRHCLDVVYDPEAACPEYDKACRTMAFGLSAGTRDAGEIERGIADFARSVNGGLHSGGGGTATGNTYRADRVRKCRRPCWRGLRR